MQKRDERQRQTQEGHTRHRRATGVSMRDRRYDDERQGTRHRYVDERDRRYVDEGHTETREIQAYRHNPGAHNLTFEGKYGRGAREGIWGPLDLTNRKSNAIWERWGGGVSYPRVYFQCIPTFYVVGQVTLHTQ